MNSSYSVRETLPPSTSILDLVGMQRFTPTSDASSITWKLQSDCDRRQMTQRTLAHNGQEETVVWDYKTFVGKRMSRYDRRRHEEEHELIRKIILFAFMMTGYTREVLDDDKFNKTIDGMVDNTIVWRHGSEMSPKSVKKMLYGKEDKSSSFGLNPRDNHSHLARQALKNQRRR